MLILSSWYIDTQKDILYRSLKKPRTIVDDTYKVSIEFRLACATEPLPPIVADVSTASGCPTAVLSIPAGALPSAGDYTWRTLLLDAAGTPWKLDDGKVTVKSF